MAGGEQLIFLVNHHSFESGGADVYVQYLAVGLTDMGFRVALSWPRHRPIPPLVTGNRGGRLRVILCDYSGSGNPRARFARSFINPWAGRRLRRVCDEISPEVIHFNQSFEGDGVDLIRSAVTYPNAKVFGTIHLKVNPPTANRWLARGKDTLMKPFFSRFPYVKIFPSRRQLTGFAEVYGNDGFLRWVPNGIVLPPIVSAEEANVRKTELGVSGRTVIGYSGRISQGKGVDILAAAFLEARRIDPKLFLLVIGDGPLRGTMAQMLRKDAQESSWLLTGWTSRVSDYLAAVDIFVLPSQFETGGPLSVLEALSMGIPCLCAPFEGVDELLARGAPLVVVEKRDVRSFTEGIIGLVTHVDQQRECIRRSLEALREEFDCRKMAEKTADVYFARQH